MSNSLNTWKVIDILKTTTDFFDSKNLENPRLNAELLLASVLNLSRVQLYLQFEKILSPQEVLQYREFIRRRGNKEPLQYITGKTEFMGLHFNVNPAVFIPRPETEFMVDLIIETIEKTRIKNPFILDVGTGSGCIAISLAYHLPDSLITATDVSVDALGVAESNAKQNEIENISFLHHDIFAGDGFQAEKLDIIVSNPPYVSAEEMDELPEEIKNHEPSVALTDFKSGLLFYEQILSLIDKGLKCKFVFLEMNARLEAEILEIANGFRFKHVNVIPDLNNLPRILKIEV
jgi:release factor glutamine methyltransferase